MIEDEISKTCRQCRQDKSRDKWSKCGGHEWYHYDEIGYCIHQVRWVIENEELPYGVWPADSTEVNSEQESNKIAANAPFTKCTEVLADVYSRLKRTGKDGDELLDSIWIDYAHSPDGEIKLKPTEELSYAARMALYYCTGWRTKTTPYARWKAQRNYRNKLKRTTYNRKE